MKFLHISDLHIGLKLFNKDLGDDQRYILNQISDIARKEAPDALLIAGDIYDKPVPSAEAVGIFNDFISDLSSSLPDMHIMIISGNHDSASRMDLYRSILSKNNIHVIGMPPCSMDEYIEKISLDDEYGAVNFYLLPFVKPSYVKDITGTDDNGNNLSYNDALHKLIERESIKKDGRNILVSHQFYIPAGKNAGDIERTDSEMPTVGNIDAVTADVLYDFDYTALGHIHKPMKLGSDFYRYSGSPLAYSVSEAGQKKGIIKVELKAKGELYADIIPLVPMREVRLLKGSFEDVINQGSDDYTSILLTDKTDLDVIDIQDALRRAFPNLLEIRREQIRTADYNYEIDTDSKLDPYELCCNFLNDISDDEKELLQDVINSII